MRFNFFIFLLLALSLLGLSKTVFVSQSSGVIEVLLSPLENTLFGILNKSSKTDQIKKLEQYNRTLQKQLVMQHSTRSDMQALKDQFQTAQPKSQNLLPAHIVGAPAFIPRVHTPSQFIINRGNQDGARVGLAVIYKDNLLGKIVETSQHLSRVDLITSPSFSLTVTALRPPQGAALREGENSGQASIDAIGVIKGKGNGEMVLENVLLSETLTVSDLIVTRGDLDITGIGIPGGLIVGKIVWVNKNPSALFQSASVQGILDITDLSLVYVVIRSEQ